MAVALVALALVARSGRSTLRSMPGHKYLRLLHRILSARVRASAKLQLLITAAAIVILYKVLTATKADRLTLHYSEKMKDVVARAKLEGREFQLSWIGQTALAHFLLMDVHGWASLKWKTDRHVAF